MTSKKAGPRLRPQHSIVMAPNGSQADQLLHIDTSPELRAGAERNEARNSGTVDGNAILERGGAREATPRRPKYKYAISAITISTLERVAHSLVANPPGSCAGFTTRERDLQTERVALDRTTARRLLV